MILLKLQKYLQNLGGSATSIERAEMKMAAHDVMKSVPDDSGVASVAGFEASSSKTPPIRIGNFYTSIGTTITTNV